MLKKILILIIMEYPMILFSQSKDSITYIKNNLSFENKGFNNLSDSVLISLSDNNDSTLNISVFNYSKNSIYLFSSYLNERYLTNQYLNRVDKNKNVLKISFLPILPSTILSDRVYDYDEKVLYYNQIKYEFIEIKPNYYYKIPINKSIIINYIKSRKYLIQDFNVSSFKQGDRLKKVKINKLKSDYYIIFEFAFFNQLDFIFKNYHSQIDDFIKDKNAYKSISIKWEPLNK